MNIFGFDINWKSKKQPQNNIVSPTPNDGSTVVDSAAAYYGMVIDLEGIVKNENDLIHRYREVAQYPDCDSAIDDIVNEVFVMDQNTPPVSINLDRLHADENIKKQIIKEFETIVYLFDVNENGHDLFRQWYIDGRIYYQIILDEHNIGDGIQELRRVDPRKIRKITVLDRQMNEHGLEVISTVEEYFLYNDDGITEQTTQGIKLSPDSIIYVPSGLIDSNTNMSLSYLHKAIKSVNQLKMMEDALVIYRISRAPERRIFYIDVGNLPKVRAEQYVNDIMNKFRNKIVYDADTGEIKDNRQHLSTIEDFWLPRREGGKGTEISTLSGGQNLGEIEDIEYFQNKLYQSLNVPTSRRQSQQPFTLGISTVITRDELKFNKFIERLRIKFSQLFRQALCVQLISKSIIHPNDWDKISNLITFDYSRDNHFTELKDIEIINNRLAALQIAEQYVGKYYSTNWIKKNILRQTDEDIIAIDKEIKAETPKEESQDTMFMQGLPQDNLGNMPQTVQPKPPAPKIDDSLSPQKVRDREEAAAKDMMKKNQAESRLAQQKILKRSINEIERLNQLIDS